MNPQIVAPNSDAGREAQRRRDRMYQLHRPLLDALARRGADAIALQSAADEAELTGRSIRDVLINDRVVTEVELTEASGDVYGISSVDLVGFPIDAAGSWRAVRRRRRPLLYEPYELAPAYSTGRTDIEGRSFHSGLILF